MRDPGHSGLICAACGMMTVGAAYGRTCNCSGFGGAVSTPGPVDVYALVNMGVKPTYKAFCLATTESLKLLKQHVLARLEDCDCNRCGEHQYSSFFCDRCIVDKGRLFSCNSELSERELTAKGDEDKDPIEPELPIDPRLVEATEEIQAWETKHLAPDLDEQLCGSKVSHVPLVIPSASFARDASRHDHEQFILHAIDELRRMTTQLEEVKLKMRTELEKAHRSNAALVKQISDHRRQIKEIKDDHSPAERSLIDSINEMSQRLENSRNENDRLREQLKHVADAVTPPTWRSALDGELRPFQFRNGHLVNTIRYIERRFAATFPGGWVGYQAEAFGNSPSARGESNSKFMGPSDRVYPFLLAEARLRGLTIEKPHPQAPSAVFGAAHLRTSGLWSDRKFSLLLPHQIDISMELYWAISDRVESTGDCMLELTIADPKLPSSTSDEEDT